MTHFYEQYKSIEPYLKKKKDAGYSQKKDGNKEYLQSIKQRSHLVFYTIILLYLGWFI